MIGCDSENRTCKRKCREGIEKVMQQAEKMREYGYSEDEIARLIAPAQEMLRRTQQEIEIYERLKNKDLSAMYELPANQRLIGLRVYMGYSRSDLASALGVTRQDVFRDERNEYCGITLEKYQRILKALNLSEICLYMQGTKEDEQGLRCRLKEIAGKDELQWFVGP